MALSSKTKKALGLGVFTFLVFGYQNMTSSRNANPTLPPEIIDQDGRLKNEAKMIEKSCEDILTAFGKKPVSLNNYVDESKIQAPISMTCKEFGEKILTDITRDKKTGLLIRRKGVITKSIRIIGNCQFPRSTVEIAASNISLDCGGAKFTGGEPSDRDLDYGLTLTMNEVDSKVSASTLPVIENIQIRNCHFENYSTSGVFLANRFSRKNDLDRKFYNDILLPMHRSNEFDLLDRPSPADQLRKLSPKNISINNVSVRNTPNGGFYIQNSITNVDISRSKAMYTRTGLYLDFGTRHISVRNSCFIYSGHPDPRRTAQDIADDDKPGREGIAVDASAGNSIVNNLFYRPNTGAVHLYKNCWESHDDYRKIKKGDKPRLAQYPRRQPSDGNVIKDNIIVEGKIGVSVAHRQWANISFSSTDSDVKVGNCGDRYFNSYVKGPTTYRVYADYARGNTVRNNTFFNLELPIRLNDDANVVQGNIFRGNRSPLLVSVGKTQDPLYRKRPVINNSITHNTSLLRGIASPASLVRFSGGARGYTEVAANSHRGEPLNINASSEESWCTLPIEVPSSNVEEESCRFDSSQSLHPEGAKLTLKDGGRIHGQLRMTCEGGVWKVSSGYCCSGVGCEKKAPSIAGEIE